MENLYQIWKLEGAHQVCQSVRYTGMEWNVYVYGMILTGNTASTPKINSLEEYYVSKAVSPPQFRTEQPETPLGSSR